ncbi:RluA family pseudouridine synthase [Cloacibacillus sp. An23]|uniref:RluA family pseudouridine synthase n=1 Tax=Cloacibacillus sp. An23 TaxID=1965591 RepID=UPI000B3A76D7|nr:RluA family pseudouridine synthase [Cloacibacillus sp. An23]OUO92237.1 pseudouridine synthase [Cloacibacillus sp. An23]
MSSENNEELLINGLSEEGEGERPAPSSFQEFEIAAELSGHRLDFALSRLIGISRAYAQKLIKEGNAALTPERRIKPSVKVAEGDRLGVEIPPAETLDLEPQDVPFEVVYDDEDIIIVNKPAGLVVHPAPGHWSGTLVHGLLFRYPGLGALNGVQRPGIVHRLDATTSGLMVVARSGLAQEGLFKEFKERRVNKEYLALCWGEPPAAEGTVKYPIGRDPYNRLKMACVEDGREAWTDYKKIWTRGGKSLVICRLHSGRTHQIRVHMQALRCPLVGDRLYAPSRPSPFGPERLFLHAWKLGFKHPRTHEDMSFVQPLPPELSSYLEELRAGTNPV